MNKHHKSAFQFIRPRSFPAKLLRNTTQSIFSNALVCGWSELIGTQDILPFLLCFIWCSFDGRNDRIEVLLRGFIQGKSYNHFWMLIWNYPPFSSWVRHEDCQHLQLNSDVFTYLRKSLVWKRSLSFPLSLSTSSPFSLSLPILDISQDLLNSLGVSFSNPFQTPATGTATTAAACDTVADEGDEKIEDREHESPKRCWRWSWLLGGIRRT